MDQECVVRNRLQNEIRRKRVIFMPVGIGDDIDVKRRWNIIRKKKHVVRCFDVTRSGRYLAGQEEYMGI